MARKRPRDRRCWNQGKRAWRYLDFNVKPPREVLQGDEVWVWRAAIKPPRWEIIGEPEGIMLDPASQLHLKATQQAQAEGFKRATPEYAERVKEIRKELNDKLDTGPS